MTVPDFQTWFMPLLQQVADGDAHKLATLYEELADQMNLSEQDRREKLPSGKQLTYRNRIGWARTYLKKAGLIESPSRGLCRITDRGRSLLEDPPAKLNVGFLKQYPEFIDFHTYTGPAEPSSHGGDIEENESSTTPEENLEKSYSALKEDLAQDLLDRVKAAPPIFFESLVVELLLRMGYGGSREDAGRTIGGSGDGGVDGIINEDRLGLDVVYIQAKRWEASVGRPVVQAFAGSLEGVRARKGVLITTSTFTADARHYVTQIEKRIVLVDGQQLSHLMFEHNLGVSSVASYDVKQIDSDFFEET